MKFGVVVFPGSNCDHDAYHAIGHVLQKPVEFIWHQSEELQWLRRHYFAGWVFVRRLPAHGRDCAIFAGDEIGGEVCKQRRAGAGRLQWVSDSAGSGVAAGRDDAEFGAAVYLQAGARPRGGYEQSVSLARRSKGQILRMPIAHSDGNYTCDEATLAELEKNRQVLFRYTTPDGKDDAAGNPNGSMANIAGICNRERNVAGLMPHPERAVEAALDSEDGLGDFPVDDRGAGGRSEGDGVSASPAQFLCRGTACRAPDLFTVDDGDSPDGDQSDAGDCGGAWRDARGVRARSRKYLGRDPNITELGIFSVMWSEHCSYKSSKVHLKRLPTRGKLVVQGPGENAGVVDIGGRAGGGVQDRIAQSPELTSSRFRARRRAWAESCATFSPWARGRSRFWIRCDLAKSRPAKTTSEEEAAKNRRILDGVIRGVGSYGNCFGVPTVGGEVAFEPCYSQNPLVNALALGIARKEEIFLAKAKGIGNPVIYVGAKTGRDGIHGASLLASAEFTEESQQKRPNVQVGDPFMEKLLLEACLEAMKTGASCGDSGYGRGGADVFDDARWLRAAGRGLKSIWRKCRSAKPGMTPYEIMLSESQERMLLVAEKGREQEVLAVFKKWGLDATVVGQVTDGGLLVVKDHGEVVAEIPAHPLAEEGPVYNRPMTAPAARKETEKDWFAFAAEGTDLTANFMKLLASPAIASKRWITEQYDTMVRTNTLAGPGASDAAVVRIKETKGRARWLFRRMEMDDGAN